MRTASQAGVLCYAQVCVRVCVRVCLWFRVLLFGLDVTSNLHRPIPHSSSNMGVWGPLAGDDPGAANVVKLAGNFLIASAVESMSEAGVHRSIAS